MTDSSSSPEARDPADLEAAAWLVKHDRGLTAAELDEFSQWLASDSRHGEWYARHCRTWTDFNLLAQWRPEHSADPNPDLLVGASLSPNKTRHRWPIGNGRLTASLLAAASLAVAAGWWVMRTQARSEQTSTVAIAPSGYEKRILEDGSVLELNRGARLLVDFAPGLRRIDLVEGEVLFNVAKDANRPFVVRAAGIDVRAIGTAFNVRLVTGEVEILVTEGKVHVDRTTRATIPVDRPKPEDVDLPALHIAPLAELSAGQRTVVSLGIDAPVPKVVAVSSEEVSRLLAWQPQLLDFESTPLREVVDAFNRHNRTQLVLGSPELAELPIVASFRSDNLDGFVRLLEITAQVRAERRAGNEILLRKAAPGAEP
jgi:transmembrane sensor